MQRTISPELILTHPARSPISFTVPTSKWSNERINIFSCYAFIDDLHVRCNGAGRKGDRNDVSDITSDIDIYAANACNKVKVEWAKGPMTEYSELVNYDLSRVEFKLVDLIIAGSICANDKLIHMGHVTDTKCKCGCPKQTIEHIFWGCIESGLADIRGKYYRAIEDIHTLLLCVQPNVLNTKT